MSCERMLSKCKFFVTSLYKNKYPIHIKPNCTIDKANGKNFNKVELVISKYSNIPLFIKLLYIRSSMQLVNAGGRSK